MIWLIYADDQLKGEVYKFNSRWNWRRNSGAVESWSKTTGSKKIIAGHVANLLQVPLEKITYKKAEK